MATDRLLGLIGLARRAGKTAVGEALTAELAAAGKVRAIFIASDIGEATRRKVMRLEERIPIFVLPYSKQEFGAALGFKDCAVCSVTDLGFAQAAAAQLAPLSPENQAAAERIEAKKTRIDRRKGTHKKKEAE